MLARTLIERKRDNGRITKSEWRTLMQQYASGEVPDYQMAALAMAMIVTLYNRRKSLDVSLWQELREAGQEASTDADPLPPSPPQEELPKLPVAGREPVRAEDRSLV